MPGQKQCMDQAQGRSEKPSLVYLQKQSCQPGGKEHLFVVYSLHCWVLGHVSAPFQTSLFGEGTYLTSDLSLALLYSPHGLGWQRSTLGSILSCVAVCEIIDHPDVKCQVKKKGESGVIETPCSSSLTQRFFQRFAPPPWCKQGSTWSVDTLHQKPAACSISS